MTLFDSKMPVSTNFVNAFVRIRLKFIFWILHLNINSIQRFPFLVLCIDESSSGDDDDDHHTEPESLDDETCVTDFDSNISDDDSSHGKMTIMTSFQVHNMTVAHKCKDIIYAINWQQGVMTREIDCGKVT